MEIIQEGNIKANIKRYSFKCQKCKCVFECEDNEVKHESWRNEDYYSHECPTCKERCWGERIAYRNTETV